jgi:hypothetical protein
MSDMGFMPQLATAVGDATGILPYRFVKLTAVSYVGAACTAITDQQIGVTDGSVYQFNNPSATQNSVSGSPINLQPNNTVLIEVGAGVTVAAGDYLCPLAAGAGTCRTAAGNTAISNYMALEDGTAGSIIKAFRFGQRGGPVFA